MRYEVKYKPTFATMFITLNPGESIITEAGAMTSMNAELSIKTELSGGLIPALLKKFFGGESMFINTFSNNTQKPLELVLSQAVIGDIECFDLSEGELCLQPGAFIAYTKGVKMGVQWAGFKSWVLGEGLFKLKLGGKGLVFFGCYGGLTKKSVTGDFLVDTSHLVAYSPELKMNIQMAGSLMASITSGEGFVNRISGNGIIYLQSRSISGLVSFLSPKVRY